jgi:hypothetical protein
MLLVACRRCRGVFDVGSVHESLPSHCQNPDGDFCRGSGEAGEMVAHIYQSLEIRRAAGRMPGDLKAA